MIYLFERVPFNVSPPNSISTCYAKFKTGVNTSIRVEQIEKEKNEFHSFFPRLITDKNLVVNESLLRPQMKYLQSTIDLLEVGDEAQFEFTQTYTPFLNAKQQIEVSKDNHSALVIEYVMSRYIFSLGGIKLLKKQMQTQMRNIVKNDSFRTDELREIIAVFKMSFLRLAKLHKNSSLIWVG